MPPTHTPSDSVSRRARSRWGKLPLLRALLGLGLGLDQDLEAQDLEALDLEALDLDLDQDIQALDLVLDQDIQALGLEELDLDLDQDIQDLEALDLAMEQVDNSAESSFFFFLSWSVNYTSPASFPPKLKVVK